MKTKMKTKGLGAKRPNLPKGQKKKGVALLTVLTVMSLATILVLTFFTLAQSELESSTSYSQGMEAKHLSETAVNMVIGQLRKATTDNDNQKRDYAWASQPGAVRVYNETGNFKAGFKLYSDDTMTVRPPGLEAELVEKDVQELNNWSSNPAVFVDLNEPVIRGKKVFYPIVDPRAKEEQKVEGFDYTTAAVGKSPLDQAVKRADSQANSLPMPVKWLYQLEDGTMGYMSGGGNKGTFVPLGSGKLPTEQNPIVGRVAFWTDDETTKLNVNTAAGGMVWDTPRTGGDIDRNFGRYQPAQHEWQRYPGHPATTSLSPVFFPGKEDIVLNRRAMDMLYELTPRVVGGGSRAGSVKAEEPNGLVADKDRLYASLDEFIFKPDRTENKFPTEFMTGSAAEVLERSRFFLTATSRAPEVTLFNTPRISIWPTYNKKNSGDEKYVTPFDNLIRFTGELGDSGGSGFDKRYQYYFQRENADSPTDDYDKIQRNKDVYAYLNTLMKTDIPGFGGKFSSKYGDNNQEQLLTEIFDYIRSTNLFDDTVYGEEWEKAFQKNNGTDHLTYTNYRQADATSRGIHMGHGQVTPIEIGTTRGFGRFYTIVEVGIQLICCADGDEVAWSASGGQTGAESSKNDRFFTTVNGGGGTLGVPYPDSSKRAYSNFPPGTMGPGPEGQPENHNNMLVKANGGVALNPGEKIVQAALLFKVFSPSQGWVPIKPDFKFDVRGAAAITIGGQSGLFPASATWKVNGTDFTNVWGGRHYGGDGGFRSLMRSSKTINGRAGRVAPGDLTSAEDYNTYPWISAPFKITGNVVAFSGTGLDIRIYSNVDDGGLPSSPQSPSVVVQEMTVNMSGLNGNMPTPALATGRREYINEFGEIEYYESSPGAFWSLSNDGAFLSGIDSANIGRLAMVNGSPSYGGRFIKEGDVCWSMGIPHGDFRLVAAKKVGAGALFKPHPLAGAGGRMAHTFFSAWGDHVAGSGRVEGNPNMIAQNKLIQISESQSHPPSPLWDDSTKWNLYGDFDNGMGNAQDGPYINKADEGNTHSLNRPAPGSVPPTAYDMRRDYGDFPYFVREYIHEPGGPSYFSPNRIMPGPGVFGSLPTEAVNPSNPNEGAWQTLLFRPDISGSGYTSHPGAKSPKDHLIMDLFWMPVVEPYAISETLSTAGKVNMNYQILPFSYITRNTALRGVFKSEVMMTVPNKHARDYKYGSGRGYGYHWKYSPYAGTLQQKSMRTFIVADKTLEQFQTEYFDKGKIFKSATEICDIHLIPKDIGEASGFNNQAGTYTPTVEQMRNGKYWRDHAVVGDNGRERPYTDIYPRLTTKSNTFKVHFRAQVLRKAKDRNPAEWDPEYDQPVGEYRGSTVVERYIDPSDPNLAGKDWATMSNLPPLDKFYKYRVLNTQRFAP
jgi:uncharacterized protein (TIGR02600 family)